MFLSNIFLGIIQGITEFLPISSSGHLLIFQKIFKTNNKLTVDIILHIATIISVIIYFRKDLIDLISGILKKDKKAIRLMFFIFVVTLVTGLIAILAKDFFERSFDSSWAISLSFMFTGIILFLTKKFMHGYKDINDISLIYAFILGIAQAFAIIPAVSRSGITIAVLLFIGLKKSQAFKISFLASIPAIVGALILEFKDVSLVLSNNFYPMLSGFIVAFLSGLFSLKLLSYLINRAKFYYFGFYCFFIAIITFFYFK